MINKGFTLIELVLVIVILGILSVTAAPKFLNLQSDAKIATLKGMAGAIKSAASIVYAKSIIAGVDNLEIGEITLTSGLKVSTKYGYPRQLGQNAETDIGIAGGKDSVVDGLTGLPYAGTTNGEWTLLTSGSAGMRISLASVYSPEKNSLPELFGATDCTIFYEEPEELGEGIVVTVDEHC